MNWGQLPGKSPNHRELLIPPAQRRVSWLGGPGLVWLRFSPSLQMKLDVTVRYLTPTAAPSLQRGEEPNPRKAAGATAAPHPPQHGQIKLELLMG